MRVPFLGKAILCHDELIMYLNGKSCVALNNFISSALKYRKFILEELYFLVYFVLYVYIYINKHYYFYY